MARFEGRLARKQTPQALLVHGPAGTGRRHVALTLAARLLDTTWRPSLDVAAQQPERVPHPDFWEVGLDEESRVIKVAQLRELIGALSLSSHGSGWKVALISPAERMNHNAANTLLKTLEEPPARTTLILIADVPAQLPATIVSRCERIRLSTPPTDVALAWLTSRHADRVACERALMFSSGAPLMANRILGDGQGPGVNQLLGDLGDELRQIMNRKAVPTTVARAWATRDSALCLRWLYLQAAELIRRQVTGSADPAAAPALLKIRGAALNMAACYAHLDQVVEAQRLKDRSLNMEVMFAELLMWWYGAAEAAR